VVVDYLNSGIKALRARRFIKIIVFFSFFCVFLKNTLLSDLIAGRNYVMDDSYISFRYADNFSEYGKLIWNKNERQPTEGYSSLIWILILAIPAKLNLNLLLAARVISVICLIATYVIVLLTAFSIIENDSKKKSLVSLALSFSSFLFFSNRNLFAHLLSGMETSFALFTLTLLFYGFVQLNLFLGKVDSINPKIEKKLLIVSLCGFLCILIRPEFGLFFLVASIFFLWQWRKLGTFALLKKLILPWSIALTIYLLVRFYFFGFKLPLPFYIKVGSSTMFAGFEPTLEFIFQASALILLILLLISFEDKIYLWTPLILATLFSLFYWLFPIHIMNYGQRFLMPYWGILTILATVGILHLSANSIRQKFIYILAVLTIVFTSWSTQQVLILNPIQTTPKILQSGLNLYGQGLQKAHVRLGKTLGDMDFVGTIAMSDAGATPYFSKWEMIDIHGLNNVKVALDRYSNIDPSGFIFASNPDLVVTIASNCSGNGLAPWESGVLESLESKGFRSIGYIEFYQNAYYLNVWTKKSSRGDLVARKLNSEALFRSC